MCICGYHTNFYDYKMIKPLNLNLYCFTNCHWNQHFFCLYVGLLQWIEITNVYRLIKRQRREVNNVNMLKIRQWREVTTVYMLESKYWTVVIRGDTSREFIHLATERIKLKTQSTTSGPQIFKKKWYIFTLWLIWPRSSTRTPALGSWNWQFW